MRSAPRMSENWPKIIFTIQVFCKPLGEPSNSAFLFPFPKQLKQALRPCLSVFEVDVGMFKVQRGFSLWLLTLQPWPGRGCLSVNASIFQCSTVQSHYFSGVVIQAHLLDKTCCWFCCQIDSTSCLFRWRINYSTHHNKFQVAFFNFNCQNLNLTFQRKGA